MFSRTYLLLKNEGALIQHCFRSSLTSLPLGSSAETGPFYVAFFTYGIGLERLLKVLLALDQWHQKRRFPSDQELKAFGGRNGHDIELLFGSVRELFQRYGIELDNWLEPDAIDNKLLGFVSAFARTNRYFNLRTLGEGLKTKDPLAEWEDLLREIYARDVPPLIRLGNEDQVDALVEATEILTVYVPSTSMKGKPLTYAEFCHDTERMQLVLPEVKWRLIKLLVPLKSLLTAVREQVHLDDNRIGDVASVPFMEEFLEFVTGDKDMALKSKDCP